MSALTFCREGSSYASRFPQELAEGGLPVEPYIYIIYILKEMGPKLSYFSIFLLKQKWKQQLSSAMM